MAHTTNDNGCHNCANVGCPNCQFCFHTTDIETSPSYWALRHYHQDLSDESGYTETDPFCLPAINADSDFN
jgi:hypothetical protein